MNERHPFLISPASLAARLSAPGTVVLDASWYLPSAGRDAPSEYRAGHVPGALFFDIDGVADHDSSLPHMLPSAADFATAVGAMGIGEDMNIVVYDGAGLASAPRAWWTFRVMGARNVQILDGGLPAWTAAGLPLETATPRRPPRTFTARLDALAVANLSAMQKTVAEGSAQVLDARPAARFRGEAPEPRPGLRGGHMPGSLSLPSADLVADGKLKSPAELRAAFASAGANLDAPIVTTCGSGITAAIITFAAEVLGAKHLALYDGSWTEWGGRQDTPVETGASGSQNKS